LGRPVKWKRRAFLSAAAALAAGGAGWTYASSSWTARFFRERIAEVTRPIPPAPHRPDPSRWSDQTLTLTWLGHATALINFFGVRILTDPVLYDRIGLALGFTSLGPKRLTGCALKPRALPEIDLVLVSHAHFDHLDTPSLATLRGRPLLVTAPATSDLLPRRRFQAVHELGWGQSLRLPTRRGEVEVEAIQVRHWGARWRRDTHRGYNGYILSRGGRRVLFAGDTAFTERFRDYRTQGPFEIGLMPIGAYNPWIRSHCTPEEALSMADAAGVKWLVPIHHQCFKLSAEPFHEPLERFQAALRNEPERIALSEVGATFVCPS
jgi:L-ascorbate metabolism protein UlaG (beta-lactamase superfamily)